MDQIEKECITKADSFFRDLGYLTPFHKNNLVLYTLLICKEAENVAFEIDPTNRTIKAIIQVKWLKNILMPTKKRIRQLTQFYNDYLPQFTFNLAFEVI